MAISEVYEKINEHIEILLCERHWFVTEYLKGEAVISELRETQYRAIIIELDKIIRTFLARFCDWINWEQLIETLPYKRFRRNKIGDEL